MSGHVEKKTYVSNERKLHSKGNSSLNKEILLNIDTGSTLNIIPSRIAYELKVPIKENKVISVKQTKGVIQLDRTCKLWLKIGNIVKPAEFFILDTDLPYALLGLKSCIDFCLEINCAEQIVVQKERRLITFSNSKCSDLSLHIIPKNPVKLCISEVKEKNEENVEKNPEKVSERKIKQCEDKMKTGKRKNEMRKNKRKNVLKISNVSEMDSGNGCTHCQTEVEEKSRIKENRDNVDEMKGLKENIGNSEIKAILEEYDDIFAKNKCDVGRVRIEPQRVRLTSDIPVSLRAYKTSPKQQEEIDNQIKDLLKAGIIKESSSPYSAPVTLAYKKEENKKTRLCVDFRKLNQLTKPDAEPLPLIETLIEKLAQSTYFSKLDMASGYWHIPIHPEDTEKLAFATCNSGLFEWQRLPFGWRNSPSIFQRTIRRILTKNKIKFAANYFDDIIIFSDSYSSHIEHIKEILNICRRENLKLKLSKCSFLQTKVQFLGYEISNGMVTPDNSNIEVIKKLKPPTNVKSLQRFLGTINVYNKFIDKYATIRHPLNNLLKKDNPWLWTESCQKSFEVLKNSLICKPILKIFNPKYACHLFVDASQTGVGAVLKQTGVSGALHPVAFHSRSLKDYEKNYCITELECLAIVDALNKFHHYLFGQKFTIHTDHAALVWLKNVKNLKGRLFRWSLQLSMYEYDIKYTKGTTNFEADMLSREIFENEAKHASHLLQLKEIEEAQKNDNLTGNFTEINNVLCLRKKGFTKIVIPFSLRQKLLEMAHKQFGHPGIQKTINLLTPVYYWQNITADIINFNKHCHTCQINKKPRQKRFGLLQSMPPVEKPFELIALDSVGGLNHYNSTKKYLTLIIDHHTRFIWGFASKSITTETYTNFLHQIFQVQVPKSVLSDRNAAFTSSHFKKFLKHYNIKQLLTTAHRPETNGKVERLGQTIITRLKCKINEGTKNIPWPKLLKDVIQEYNLTPHSVTKFPPAYLMYGTLPYTNPLEENIYPPVEEARKIALDRTKQYHEKNKIHYDARFSEIEFSPNQLVIYEEFKYPNTRKLSPAFSGPYKVLKKITDVNYEINKRNTHTKENTEIVHVSKLRQYYAPEMLTLQNAP